MSAALIDLVSVGAQDVYIKGNPEVSFFRQNYKRHTNFSIKPERMDYIGTFGANNEVSIPIKSKGDLLSYVWIEATNINRSENINTSLFDSSTTPTEFSLWIGGQEVTKLDSLFIAGVHNVLYNESQAKASCATTSYKATQTNENTSTGSYVIPFFFSEDWTKSLPLVGLQYHEVEIRIKLHPNFTPGSTPKVYGSYVYLDTEEREFFANTEHELLITQTQYQPMSKTDTSVDLTYFNHPVKAVHIACAEDHATKYSFTDASMYINGVTLFENMTYEYHNKVVPSRHCSILSETLDKEPVATWPFCLTMNKTQPTGSLNFSRIDNAKITIKGGDSGDVPAALRAYAVNYNILRIKNGMGGIAFGN